MIGIMFWSGRGSVRLFTGPAFFWTATISNEGNVIYEQSNKPTLLIKSDAEDTTTENDDDFISYIDENASYGTWSLSTGAKANIPESTPAYAALALSITMQDWSVLGFGDDTVVAASRNLELTVERITSLLLVRIVAVACTPHSRVYTDLSTTTICRSELLRNEPWPEPISPELIRQLRKYVYVMMSGYNDTPYHNFEHAYHVTVSANKLLDLMLNVQQFPKNRRPPTFGLRDDALLHLALLFSAVVHDVEHTGISNRQLSLEHHPLAVLYNDQAVAENRSLFLAFSELLKADYDLLRSAMFQSTDEYIRFRKTVVDLILTTDIASPERTQVTKSKWKEAFGDPFESLERKVRKHARRGSMGSIRHPVTIEPERFRRRGSAATIYSELTVENVLDGSGALFSFEQSGQSGYEEDDASLSDTPENSDHEDGVITGGITMSAEYGVEDEKREKTQIKSRRGLQPIRSGFVYPDGIDPEPSPPEAEESETYGTADQYTEALETAEAEDDKREKTHVKSRPGLQPIRSGLVYPDGIDPEPSPPEAEDSEAYESFKSAEQYTQKLETAEANETAESTSDVNHELPDANAPIDRNTSGIKSDGDMPKQRTSRRATIDNSPGIRASGIHKFQRRLSAASNVSTQRYRQRLGIRRSMDFSGEQIETFSRASTTRGNFSGSDTVHKSVAGEETADIDQPDELKAMVVLETMMKAADVAHNLQGWDHMEKWSNMLFLELRKAHVQGRGFNPRNEWYKGQIGFLESVLLPLAHQLDDMGVFGDEVGPVFARIVEGNRDRWLTDGMAVCNSIIPEAERLFPGSEIQE